jgi:hypothetical protein
MSHLDDLDEYEAELELALKREYQAVFALFRYCVLTQDATYLCNKLELQRSRPQPRYPFFQLDLRTSGSGTRTGRPDHPAHEVFTSATDDRGAAREGDEPTLTAEALAERIGEPLRADDDVPLGMLLAVDVGNTQTVLRLFDGDRLDEHSGSAPTRAHGDELA